MTPTELAAASACFSCVPNQRAGLLYVLAVQQGLTDPTTISANAACWRCISDFQSAFIYLLARLANITSPTTIAASSACYACLPDQQSALLYSFSDGLTPQEISTGSRCMICIPDYSSALLYLLARMAGISDPNVVAQNSAPFQSLSGLNAAVLYLGDQINMNNSTFATTTPVDYNIAAAFGYTTNSQNFPGLLGLTFLPSSTIAGYFIEGQTSLQSLIFSNLQSVPANALFNFRGNTVLTSISFPALTSSLVGMLVDGAALTTISMPVLQSFAGINNNGQSFGLTSLSLPALTSSTGLIQISACASLLTVSMPLLNNCVTSGSTTFNFGSCANLSNLILTSLVSTTRAWTFTNCTSLTTLNLPALVSACTVGGAFSFSGCSALATVSFPNYLPTNARNQTFLNCALTQASVDHILARCVASAGYISGTINTSGGTSAAPGVQGQLDKAALILRGCTVTTN